MRSFFSSAHVKLFSYFILLSLFGACLLQIPSAYRSGSAVSFIDALFTSVSAVCVTGLSTVSMSLYSHTGFVIILFLIEFGGLGIITFIAMYLAVPSKKVSSVNRKLVKDYFIDDVENNPRKILHSIVGCTLLIQLAGALCLIPALRRQGIGTYLFDAVFLSVSAFCNAGFSPYADSLSSVQNNPSVIIPIMLLIISGGIGFIVLQNIFQTAKTKSLKKRRTLTLHSKMVLSVTAFLIVGGALIVFVSEYAGSFQNLSLPQKIMASFFQSVTTRTAGFETVPQKNFSAVSELTSLFLMFIGGSSGSIAGGIKTTTFFIAVFYALNGNESKHTVQVGNRTVDSATVNKAVTIITRSMLLLCVSIFCMVIAERRALAAGRFQIIDVIFESVSAFATVGLSQGITAALSSWGKAVIILTMFIGRTGIFAMALHFPRGKALPDVVEYPNDKVLVG